MAARHTLVLNSGVTAAPPKQLSTPGGTWAAGRYLARVTTMTATVTRLQRWGIRVVDRHFAQTVLIPRTGSFVRWNAMRQSETGPIGPANTVRVDVITEWTDDREHLSVGWADADCEDNGYVG